MGVDLARGATYAVGRFARRLKAGERELTTTGLPDAFVAKIDDRGVVKAVAQLGGEGLDTARAVAVSEAGIAYVGGTVTGKVSAGDDELVGPSRMEGPLLARVDGEGKVVWARSMGATCSGEVETLAAAGDEVIVGGVLGGTGCVLQSVGVPASEPSSRSGLFFARVSADGATKWLRVVEAPEPRWLRRVLVTPGGTIVAVGYARGAVEGAVPMTPEKPATGSSVGFVILLDGATGTLRQSFHVGSRNIDQPKRSNKGYGVDTFVELYDAVVDPKGGVCVVGDYWATFFAPGRSYNGQVEAFVGPTLLRGGGPGQPFVFWISDAGTVSGVAELGLGEVDTLAAVGLEGSVLVAGATPDGLAFARVAPGEAAPEPPPPGPVARRVILGGAVRGGPRALLVPFSKASGDPLPLGRPFQHLSLGTGNGFVLRMPSSW